jgi:hypothetical protein
MSRLDEWEDPEVIDWEAVRSDGNERQFIAPGFGGFGPGFSPGFSPWVGGFNPWFGGFSPWFGGFSPWLGGFNPWFGGFSPWFGGFGGFGFCPPSRRFCFPRRF